MRRIMSLSVVLGIAALCIAVGTVAQSAEVSSAKEDYATFCAKCHGPGGKADGPAAATLKTRPGDFTDCSRMAKFSDDTLFNVIKNGGQAASLSKDMPLWKQGLDDNEIKDLVAYIRGLCKK